MGKDLVNAITNKGLSDKELIEKYECKKSKSFDKLVSNMLTIPAKNPKPQISISEKK